jgi:hypothetical protein
MGCMNKKKRFENDAPLAHDLHDANRIIQELWNQLREYEDRLAQSSRNSSKSPSSDSPAVKAERKKLRRLVTEIRSALNLDTLDIDGH